MGETGIDQILSKPASEMTLREMLVVLRKALKIMDMFDGMIIEDEDIPLAREIDQQEELFTIAKRVMESFVGFIGEWFGEEDQEMLIAKKALEIVPALGKIYGPTVDCRFLRDLAKYQTSVVMLSDIVLRKLIEIAEKLDAK